MGGVQKAIGWLRTRYDEVFGEAAKAHRRSLSMRDEAEAAQFRAEFERMMPRILGSLYGKPEVKAALRGDDADAYLAALIRHIIANVSDEGLRRALEDQYFGRPGPWFDNI